VHWQGGLPVRDGPAAVGGLRVHVDQLCRVVAGGMCFEVINILAVCLKLLIWHLILAVLHVGLGLFVEPMDPGQAQVWAGLLGFTDLQEATNMLSMPRQLRGILHLQ